MKDIRKGFWQRSLSSGKVAGSVARLAGRKLLGANEDATDGALGDAIARELDQMKGMAMKVGQIVSYFDGILPEATHAALRALQTGATSVAFERMEEEIVAAFGAPVDTLFDSFDRRAIAAASIGQVYRARYKEKDVAVKVQYPGIRQTMRADFSRLDSLSRIASLATAVDGPALVGELRRSLDEECDYLREASHQAEFAAAFADDASIRIPRVFSERTRTTVITTEWATGRDFYSFIESENQATKNEIALTLLRFALRSLFVVKAINADPHPGNYLFPNDRQVVFLDFGCVRRFDDTFLSAYRHLMEVVIDDRNAAFREALLATGMVAKEKCFDFEHHWRLLRHEYAPYCTSHFRFDRAWLKQTAEFSKPGSPNLRVIHIPPEWIWLERLLWGLHAVLTRLGAEGDFNDVMRRALADGATFAH